MSVVGRGAYLSLRYGVLQRDTWTDRCFLSCWLCALRRGLGWSARVAWKVPKEELPLLILLVGDWQKTSIAFADVPRGIGQGTVIDGKR